MPNISLILVTLTLIYALRRFVAYRNALNAVNNHPGARLLLSPLIGMFIPKIKYLSGGANHAMDDKFEPFAEAGWDIHTVVTVLPVPWTIVSIADPTVIKEIASSRARFPKPIQHYKAIAFFGPNIVVSEGEEWKKYRRIAAPAFADRNYKLVWEESVANAQGLFEGPWKDRDIIEVDHFADTALMTTLFVISAAGFGMRISWDDDTNIPAGHSMSFKDALHIVARDVLWKIACPDWMLGLTKPLRRTRQGFKELRTYMEEMIIERRNRKDAEQHDLFSRLLSENSNADDFTTLSDDELIGNIYIFLMAGHETTGITLTFALALLALYPNEQETLYSHIRSVVPENRDPCHEDMPSLTYVLAVLYETLRMFPPNPVVPKESAEDTIVTTTDSNGESRSVPIPKGALIHMSSVGTHYNPRYWQDPFTFRPGRFLQDWPRDAFLPFSAGARACLGRKFFETEAVAILSMIILRYKVTVKEEPQFAGETFEQKKNRVTANRWGPVLRPNRIPLTFTRRR